MHDWNARQYLKFERERTRPARDLLAQVPPRPFRRIADLGCGPGNSTELLAERFPEAAVLGVDASPDMLRQARERLPRVGFVQADLSAWAPPAGTDLLFANAVFQWVPDHLAVLRRLVEALPAGGVLAVQMPDNLDAPSHRLMRDTAAAGPWAGKLAGAAAARDVLAAPGGYYDALAPLCRRIDLWHTTYRHVLDGVDGIVEWVQGTGLRPFLAPLGDEERAAYLAEYRARLAEAYPAQADGRVLFPFRRLFLVAER